jgi:hypothetical protein
MKLPNTLNLELPFGITLPEVNSLHITFNQHMSYYETIEEMESALGSTRETFGWASDEERSKAIANNSLWTAQLYDLTPIGSYHVAASSLESVLRALVS